MRDDGKLLAVIGRHLAKTDKATRDQILDAIRNLSVDPNAETARTFAERIHALPLNTGVRRSVIGAVMNSLSRRITTISA
ncbi:hypothetical protein SAMN05519103_00749 [Rhizobiales bacterium GAS113]|jgi:hypothetical protein|nr:hypothetical protein SAMN05519103_00749 [Rhizobiales bacterium GAS113]SEC59131.1 hypothetical protein SAMN05519104_1674 [Rhizobiales bacterium GAS188]